MCCNKSVWLLLALLLASLLAPSSQQPCNFRCPGAKKRPMAREGAIDCGRRDGSFDARAAGLQPIHNGCDVLSGIVREPVLKCASSIRSRARVRARARSLARIDRVGAGLSSHRELFESFPVSFQQCCNKHDNCYGTCGTEKGLCDRALHSCVETIWSVSEAPTNENQTQSKKTNHFAHAPTLTPTRRCAGSQQRNVEREGARSVRHVSQAGRRSATHERIDQSE